MDEGIEVYLPCQVLRVKVLVGPEQGMSTLERLFLRAILRGVHGFAELCEMFGLGARPTLDLVFDMWQKGHVVLDLARSSVLPAAHITERSIDELESSDVTEEDREVMLDRVTGHVLPLDGQRSAPRDTRRIIPTNEASVSLEGVTTEALLAAVRHTLDRERRQNRGMESRLKKVLQARLSFSQLHQSGSPRWLKIRIAVLGGATDDLPRIEILDQEWLPAGERKKLVRHVLDRIEEAPRSEFSRLITESRTATAVAREPLPTLIRRLDGRIEGLTKVDVALREKVHGELTTLSNVLRESLVDAFTSEVETTVLTTQAEHLDAVVRLIRAAEHQIVLVSPWIEEGPFTDLRGELRDALARGVQVFLLWGFDGRASLEQTSSGHAARNEILRLQTAFPHLLRFSPNKSSSTHAKVIVSDDRQALVSSLNFLRPSREVTLELGLHVRSRVAERVCTTIGSILEWARDAFPEYESSQLMICTRDGFQPPGSSELDDLPAPLEAPELPALAHKADTDPASFQGVAVRSWAASWAAFLAEARSIAEYGVTRATVLVDSEHRATIREALESAEVRILLTSDRLGIEVVHDGFLRLLESRLKAGVQVILGYRRLTRRTEVEGAPLLRRLDDLRVSYSGLKVLSREENHAKVLVYDDVAVVGSFNFLSFEGYYEEHKKSIRRKQRSELSLRITGAGIADRVAQRIAERFPEAFVDWPKMRPSRARSQRPHPHLAPLLGEVVTLAEELASATSLEDRVRLVRTAVRQREDPWAFLQSLQDCGLPEPDLGRAAAQALLGCAEGERSGGYDHWLEWLAERAWRDGDHVVAAAILHQLPACTKPTLPSREVALLAAAWDVDQLATALGEGWSPDEVDTTVMGIAAVAELALRGSLEAVRALQLLEPTLPPACAAVSRALIAYWQVTSTALPIQRIMRDLDVKAHRAAVAEAWNELSHQVELAAATQFKWGEGKVMHRKLFTDEGGVFQRLRVAVKGSDTSGLQAWLEANESREMGALIDDVMEGIGGDPVADNKRRSYLGAIATVLATARRVYDLASVGKSESEGWRIKKAIPVAACLREHYSGLKQEARMCPPGNQLVARRLRATLVPVARWNPKS